MTRAADLRGAILALVTLVSGAPTAALAQQPVDHSQHQPVPAQPPSGADEHAQHQHGTAEPSVPALPPFVPPVTDADRRAAFPEVHDHEAHDNRLNSFVLLDQIEWQSREGVSRFNWDDRGWVGRDLDRVWFRTEGVATDRGVEDAEAHLLYGRAIARWWDIVGGVRQDVRPGDPQTWGAIGLQGLAPYWFELAVTGYVGPSARTSLRLEAEYELLLTNRLIAKPLVEVDLYGRSDPARGIGAGLSSVDAGLRLRYEFRREIAPYVGLTWNRKYRGTAGPGAAGRRVRGRGARGHRVAIVVLSRARRSDPFARRTFRERGPPRPGHKRYSTTAPGRARAGGRSPPRTARMPSGSRPAP